MKVKEAKQIIESEFGDLKKEDRSQYDTLISLLVKYGADESRQLEKLVIQKIADGIVDELFINGAGEKAKRLVLELEDKSNGGGWGKLPVKDIIIKHIKSNFPA